MTGRTRVRTEEKWREIEERKIVENGKRAYRFWYGVSRQILFQLQISIIFFIFTELVFMIIYFIFRFYLGRCFYIHFANE